MYDLIRQYTSETTNRVVRKGDNMVNDITAKEIEEIRTEVRKVYEDLAKLCKMFGLEVPDFTEDENRMVEEKLKLFRLLKQHPGYGYGSTTWRIDYNY